jgi:hypothetical protein
MGKPTSGRVEEGVKKNENSGEGIEGLEYPGEGISGCPGYSAL